RRSRRSTPRGERTPRAAGTRGSWPPPRRCSSSRASSAWRSARPTTTAAATTRRPARSSPATARARRRAPPRRHRRPPTAGPTPDVPDGRLEVGDLGTFASADDLVDHVAGRVPGDHQVLPGADDGVPPEPAARVCSTPPAPLDDPSVPARLHGHAIVDGTPVDVWVVDDGGRARRLAVDRDCRLAIDRLLP